MRSSAPGTGQTAQEVRQTRRRNRPMPRHFHLISYEEGGLPMSQKASVCGPQQNLPGIHCSVLSTLKGNYSMLMDLLAHGVLSESSIPSAALGCSCFFQAGGGTEDSGLPPTPPAVAAGGLGDVPLPRLCCQCLHNQLFLPCRYPSGQLCPWQEH